MIFYQQTNIFALTFRPILVRSLDRILATDGGRLDVGQHHVRRQMGRPAGAVLLTADAVGNGLW